MGLGRHRPGAEGLKLHPRTLIVQRAKVELSTALSDIIEKHDLTFGEVFSVLAQESASWAKVAVREERHPRNKTGKGGDEA